jgi:hypothetical protein
MSGITFRQLRYMHRHTTITVDSCADATYMQIVLLLPLTSTSQLRQA